MQNARLVRYRGAWYAAWRERGATRRASLRVSAAAPREDAERALADFHRAASRRPGVVCEIIAGYRADREGQVKPVEAIHYRWKRLLPHFGHLRPDQVDRMRCRAYIEWRRREGASDGTIIRELGVLRAAIRWADPRTPAVFELPRAPAPRDRHLSREEYERLLAAGAAPHVRLFIVLALATAGRASAILELEWRQVDFGRGLISLGGRQEGRKDRATVPMTGRAREALEEARRAALTPWVIEYAGRQVSSIKKAFARTAARAGLDNVSPHVLRHTAAVWLAEAGVSMAEIARYLGHRDSRITERVYARFGPDYLRKAAKALDG